MDVNNTRHRKQSQKRKNTINMELDIVPLMSKIVKKGYGLSLPAGEPFTIYTVEDKSQAHLSGLKPVDNVNGQSLVNGDRHYPQCMVVDVVSCPQTRHKASLPTVSNHTENKDCTINDRTHKTVDNRCEAKPHIVASGRKPRKVRKLLKL